MTIFVKQMANKKSKAFTFIFITVLIDMMGIGIIIPVLPKLIMELTGSSTGNGAVYGGIMQASYAIMLFIASPIIGGLSDKFGRKPMLILALAGLGIDYLFLAFAPTFTFLVIGRIIAGVFGASHSTAMAYVADISEPHERGKNMGMIHAAFGVGFILGPVIGGIAGDFGTKIPFFVAAGLTLLNMLFGLFVVPESLTKENRRNFDWKRANPLGAIKQAFHYKGLILLLGAIFLMSIAGQVHPSTWTFYTVHRFGWSSAMIGYSLGVVGLVIAIVQGGLIRKTLPYFGHKKSVYLGLGFTIFGYLLFANSTQPWMMFAFMVPFGLGGLATPAIQGIISNSVPDSEQGEIQGTIASLMSLSGIIGPLLMTATFSYFSNEQTLIYYPGAAFALSALICIIGGLLIIAALKGRVIDFDEKNKRASGSYSSKI